MGIPIFTYILAYIMTKIHNAILIFLFYPMKGSNTYIPEEKVDNKLLIYLRYMYFKVVYVINTHFLTLFHLISHQLWIQKLTYLYRIIDMDHKH